MNIFLTGVSGFVGRNLAGELIKKGHSVTAAVRSTSDVSLIPAECKVVEVNLESIQDVSLHLKNMEVVFHVAGAVKARSGEDFDRINAGLTA